MPTDCPFRKLLNKVIEAEPPEGSDPTTVGLFAPIGIEKGKPLAPDARMRAILTDAANLGAVMARALVPNTRGRDAFFYPDSKSNWRLPFFGGYRFQSQPGVSNQDGAAFCYFCATGVTPAMEEKLVGQGSQYPWKALDAEGKPLDGGQTYRPTLPKDVPVKDFWSVMVCGVQTRSMIQTDQSVPSVSGQNQGVKTHADGSVDVFSGPKAPEGMESNWVQAIPGKGWFMILRLYGPPEPWFGGSWKPDEITKLD